MLVIIAKKTVAIEEIKPQSVIASLVRTPEIKLTYKTEWYTESVVLDYELQNRLNKIQSEGYEIFQVIDRQK